ncbi:MAG: DUF4013 domain-containing protein [Candidatus Diapherotrites archaeon]
MAGGKSKQGAGNEFPRGFISAVKKDEFLGGFVSAVKKPFTNANAWLIGIILSLPVINLLGIFYLAGYSVRISRMVMRGDDAVIDWDKAGNRLVVDGIKFLAIYLVYLVPAIICVFAALLMLGIMVFLGGDWVVMALGFAFALFALLFAIPGMLFGTSAVLNFARFGSIAHAFDFGAVAKVALDMRFIKAFAVALLYGLLLKVVTLGIFFPLLAFPAFVTFFTIVADAYRQVK